MVVVEVVVVASRRPAGHLSRSLPLLRPGGRGRESLRGLRGGKRGTRDVRSCHRDRSSLSLAPVVSGQLLSWSSPQLGAGSSRRSWDGTHHLGSGVCDGRPGVMDCLGGWIGAEEQVASSNQI